ncbi:MAG TPA: hypothetical protein VFG04_13280 [Planctomycetaceae bacterium]|jgi:hypothetical protein|nr:hypothetical protein [Planctomycetaceae bacterium]
MSDVTGHLASSNTAPIAQSQPVNPASAAPVAPVVVQPIVGLSAVDPNIVARKKFSSALANGRALVRAGIYMPARERFNRIVSGAPGTEIATEAQQELNAIANK